MPLPSDMRAPSTRRPVRAAAVLMLFLTAGGAAAAEGQLGAAVWRARFLGREVHGVACWLASPRGELRVELARLAEPAGGVEPHLARLLGRRGRGTTVIVPQPGVMLLQPWGEEWRELDPPLTDQARTLLWAVDCARRGGWGPRTAWGPEARVLPSGRDGAPRPRWGAASAEGDSTLRLEVGATDPGGPGGLRRELTSRGRGRGGRGEVWRLARHGPELTVRSSRWPGALTVGAVRERAVTYPEYETFLPLWSLERLLAGEPGGR